jgi:hypothetical protein
MKFLRNILIQNENLKIANFGALKLLTKVLTVSQIGTGLYSPPEIMIEESYNLKSDVW